MNKTLSDEIANFDIEAACADTKTYKFGKYMLGLGKTILVYRPALSVGLTLLMILGSTVLTALGQPPNAFGGSGASKASNAANNGLAYLAWASGIIGIGCIFGIGYKKMTEQPWTNMAWGALIFLGGFGILGSVAYDIVNLNSVDIADPTLGN